VVEGELVPMRQLSAPQNVPQPIEEGDLF